MKAWLWFIRGFGAERVEVKKTLSIMAACLLLQAGTALADCTRTTVSGARAPLLTAGNFNATLLDHSILVEANYQRCRAGLPRLSPLAQLRNPAQDHSNWMAKRNKLSHKSTVRGRKTLRDRVKSTGIAARSAAENLAFLPLFALSCVIMLLTEAVAGLHPRMAKRSGPIAIKALRSRLSICG